jgi:hypothetical protein
VHFWEDVFQLFVKGVGEALDSSLREAIDALRKAEKITTWMETGLERRSSTSPGPATRAEGAFRLRKLHAEFIGFLNA